MFNISLSVVNMWLKALNQMIEIRSLSIDLDLNINVVNMRLKNKALSQGVMKLSRLQANFVSITW